MKAVLYDKSRDEWCLVDRPKPKLAFREALVRVTYAGLCGSDMNRIKSPGKEQEIFPLGHEIAGFVEQAPSRKNLEGKAVTVNPIIHCGTCSYCTKGQSQFCQHSKNIGKTAPGGFSEYISVPISQIHVLPKSMDKKLAVLTDGVAVIINALSKIPSNTLQKTLVIGDGTLAALSLAVIRSKDKNAALYVSGRNAQNMARLNAIYNSASLLSASQVRDFDVSIESVGRAQEDTFGLAVAQTREGGAILVLGVYPEGYRLGLNARQAFYKELSIFGVNSFVVNEHRDDFRDAVRVLVDNPKLFSGLVTHEIPLKNFRDGIECMNNKAESGAIKIAFCP